MSDLIPHRESRPATIEGLAEYVLLEREKLQLYRQKLKSADHLRLKDIYDQTLREGQIVGEEALYAEAALGEALEARPPAKVWASRGGSPKPLPKSVSQKASHQAQQLHRNRAKIEAAVARSKEKGYIPTRRDVLNDIAKETQQKQRDRQIAETEKLVGVYRVIYADPPWEYNDKREGSTGTTGARHHFPTMTLDELKALRIQEIAAGNSVLFLWATSPMLPEALELMEEAWGFCYKSSFVWDKIRHNMGHYNSVRHELLLLGTRGSCLPDTKSLVDSVVSIERGRHSEKPVEFRQMIDRLYPRGSRVELFARSPADGWQSWGYESERIRDK